MPTVNPKISVCIPAYNRPEVLSPLLDSILSQDYPHFEIIICEDNSPRRNEIAAIVRQYAERYSGIIRYHENETNLGYDGNLRNLVALAEGDYCLFMGNDDLICPGALSRVASAVERHDNVGVVLRSYASFEDTPENIVQTFRYFDRELFFPAGPQTVITFYRRSVVISGMMIHRQEALKHSTDRFDGTLLYQLYLVANLLTKMNGVSLPDILVLYRSGGVPDFGNSEKEKGKFVPKAQTPESSLTFIKGMLDIARYVETTRKVPIFKNIVRDIGNYSYPILSIQSGQPASVFMSYSYRLARMGFGRNKMFYLYFFLLLVLGARRVDKMIGYIKARLGHTPSLGKVYRGGSV